MTVFRALLVPFVAGITVFLVLSSKPHFRDAESWPWVDDSDSEAFYEARESKRTREGQLADAGLGVATLAFCVAWMAFALGARPSTLSRKWEIVILANVSLAAAFVGEFLGIARDQMRGEFPPWADSMGIPIAAFFLTWEFLAPLMTVALLMCLCNARLPAPLWRRPDGWVACFSNVLICLVIGVEIVFIGDAVRTGRVVAIAAHVAMVYWMLCARAAAASQRAPAR